MGERTSALKGVRSILDIHEEYGGKASRIVKTDETLNYTRAENSAKRLAKNLTKDVKSSIVDSTNSRIENSITELNKQLTERLGVGLSDSQKSAIMSSVQKTMTGKFRGLTLNQRLKNSERIVQERMTEYTKLGMEQGQFFQSS